MTSVEAARAALIEQGARIVEDRELMPDGHAFHYATPSGAVATYHGFTRLMSAASAKAHFDRVSG